MKNIAIFASGGGSNALKIIQYFKDIVDIQVSLILSNNHTAGVLAKARDNNIKTITFDRDTFYQSDEIIQILLDNKIDIIVLAGFLWLVPDSLISVFPNKIINIHPALLPKYGGKGMYGKHVHQAVKDAHESESGITIHYVNGKYDDGQTIFQAKVSIHNNDTPKDIARKVLELEHQHFASVIERVLIMEG